MFLGYFYKKKINYKLIPHKAYLIITNNSLLLCGLSQ